MKLIIPANMERKLNAYVQGVDGEIAGMGKVEARDDGNLYVTDLAIYDQEVTSGTADLSPQALAVFQTELVKRGESPKNWYLWWHSHDRMSAFFSQTDTGTIASSNEFDHLLSLVVNKRRERKARFDTHRINGVPARITLDNVVVEVTPEYNARVVELEGQISILMDQISLIQEEVPGGLESVTQEIAAKVRIKKWGGPVGYGAHGQKELGAGKKEYLEGEYDDSWSKSRKKSTGVITPEELIEGRYDRDEIELLMDECRALIRAHAGNGNADSPECTDMRMQLSDLYKLLGDLDEGDYNTDEHYWSGERWVYIRDYGGEEEDAVDPKDYIMPLPQNNKHNHGRTERKG